MSQMVDTTCTKIILSMLGINMDKPKWVIIMPVAARQSLTN
jgi:hypothetical protein